MKFRMQALAAAVLLGALLLPETGRAQTVAGESVRASPSASGSQAAPAAQPGDRVVLKIWNEPEMSDTFTVAQDGQVILPRLGATSVAGVEIQQLQESLRDAYATYLRNPSVEVIVLRRISVLGEVRQPGIYMADLTMGIPQLVALAGGVTPNGDQTRVTVVRESERMNFTHRNQQDMFIAQLRSGDQIHIPQRSFFVRNGVTFISAGLAVATTILLRVIPL